MAQQIICIIAGQRAGTNALQRAIEESGAAINFGEIFHPQPVGMTGPSRMFKDFARNNNICVADMMDRKGTTDIAEKYVAWIKEGAQPKHALIDVKFNSWSVLSPAFRFALEEPFFLRYLKDREKALFIYIWRENLAEQVLSDLISNEIKIWHNLDADKVAGKNFEIPMQRAKWLARLICRAEADMREYLWNYENKIMIKYEDLFEDGVLTDKFKTQFKKLIDIDFPSGLLGYIRPNTANKREIATNYDEVVAAINDIAAKHRRLGK
jgi:hypothetical protein